MGSKKHYVKVVQKFVDYLNTQNFEAKEPENIPVALRGPVFERIPEWFTWKIVPAADNCWISDLERKLPRRYPEPFHILISDYCFCDFQVGPIVFFANTGENVFYELAHRAFADKHMSPFLVQNGYLQFGQAEDYDPICFAPRDLKARHESRIVRLDHEEILINNRIKMTAEIAPSIEDFMERTIKGEFEIH